MHSASTRSRSFALLLISPFLAATAFAQTTVRASTDASGDEGDRDHFAPALSADGRLCAFHSASTDLVVFDANSAEDVFVKDLCTGAIERVSVHSSGSQGDGASTSPSISADGLIVAFSSNATNLVPGDTNAKSDVFVHDRTTGTTTRVSVSSTGTQADGACTAAAISADGRFVAFLSAATNLVANDLNGKQDVFVHDRVLATTERVSVDSSGTEADKDSSQPSISGDGKFVAFTSSANLAASDTGTDDDVFLHDRATGSTIQVSVDSSGNEGAGNSSFPSVAADGSAIAFQSYADDLVPSDQNGAGDVFVRVLATNQTIRVSVVDSSGGESDDASIEPRISSWGDRVCFKSRATNLDPNDTNGWTDIFVHDRFLGTTSLASLDHLGGQSNDSSEGGAISGDGRSVAFVNFTDLDGTGQNGTKDVWVRGPGCDEATWTNYGEGAPGALGVPALVALTDPVLGGVMLVQIDNSAGVGLYGYLLLGFDRSRLPFKRGTLLVDFDFLMLLVIPYFGLVLSDTLPADPALLGLVVDLQVLELDPAAAGGLSFTPGLELVLGSY